MAKDVLYSFEEVDEGELRQEGLERLRELAGSINAVSAMTGIPRSTLQNLYAGRTTQPSQRTLSLLEQAFNAAPLQVQPRRSSVAVTTLNWTARRLANLVPPPGATDWLAVMRTGRTQSGLGSLNYRSLRDTSPGDLLMEQDFDPSQVRFIVWGFRGRG